MPNGGIHPSCFVCRWAVRDPLREQLPDFNPLIDPVTCGKHGWVVWLPASHVCADLGDTYDGSGLATFAERENLVKGSLYVWIEFQYRTEQAPTIPQYVHDLVVLAKFAEYAGWSTEEKQRAYRAAYQQQLLLRLLLSEPTI